jgi:hypothetical protein
MGHVKIQIMKSIQNRFQKINIINPLPICMYFCVHLKKYRYKPLIYSGKIIKM